MVNVRNLEYMYIQHVSYQHNEEKYSSNVIIKTATFEQFLTSIVQQDILRWQKKNTNKTTNQGLKAK